jgi:hypothetical protein
MAFVLCLLLIYYAGVCVCGLFISVVGLKWVGNLWRRDVAPTSVVCVCVCGCVCVTVCGCGNLWQHNVAPTSVLCGCATYGYMMLPPLQLLFMWGVCVCVCVVLV